MKNSPTTINLDHLNPEPEQFVQTMKRADYKAIKHMNKDQLTHYLSRIYLRGYNKGVEDTIRATNNPPIIPAVQESE